MYVRSKQKVQDKVSPLENSYENTITEGCLMAETLNAGKHTFRGDMYLCLYVWPYQISLTFLLWR